MRKITTFTSNKEWTGLDDVLLAKSSTLNIWFDTPTKTYSFSSIYSLTTREYKVTIFTDGKKLDNQLFLTKSEVREYLIAKLNLLWFKEKISTPTSSSNILNEQNIKLDDNNNNFDNIPTKEELEKFFHPKFTKEDILQFGKLQFENLHEKCKFYEKNISPEKMIVWCPIILRFDGNRFSQWTKWLNKPFDENLTKLMQETTKFLIQETWALVWYTQSDEITLILYNENETRNLYHNWEKQKILSKLTAKLVDFFNNKRKELLPNHKKTAIFDCRIYQVPTLYDAYLQLLWRENDAIKNSISMMAYSIFDSSSLLKKSSIQKILMIKQSGKGDWTKLPSKYRKGSYFKSSITKTKFTHQELEQLPPNHNAKKDPNLLIERKTIIELDVPDLNSSSYQDIEPLLFSEHPTT